MKLFLILCCSLFALHNKYSQSARILSVFPLPAPSANYLYQRLLKGLADRGHFITNISPYEFQLNIVNGSVRDVVLTGFYEKFQQKIDTIGYDSEQVALLEKNVHMETVTEIYNETFRHRNVRSFLRHKLDYDVLIVDYFYSESLLVFAKLYQCPIIVFSSTSSVQNLVGNPLSPAYVQHPLNRFTTTSSLTSRLVNFFYYAYDFLFTNLHSVPLQTRIVKSALKKKLHEDIDLSALYQNISLVLFNSHTSIHQAIPFVPNTVEVGGFHIDPPEELHPELKSFVDGAESGVILFSMGAVIQSKNFPETKKKLLLNVFKKLKLRIVWKYEGNDLRGEVPSNVLIQEWVPQRDLLAHPNVKLFITHGGHNSIMETIFYGIPALVIPIFSDQFTNARRAESDGYALKLPFHYERFTEDYFEALINELITNRTYREKIKAKSVLFKDRPTEPLDTALYWIEYVIRFQGADHLRVAGLKLSFYEFFMLDVVGVALGVIVGGVLIVLGVVKSVCCVKRVNKVKKD